MVRMDDGKLHHFCSGSSSVETQIYSHTIQHDCIFNMKPITILIYLFMVPNVSAIRTTSGQIVYELSISQNIAGIWFRCSDGPICCIPCQSDLTIRTPLTKSRYRGSTKVTRVLELVGGIFLRSHSLTITELFDCPLNSHHD
jgi:hypothetical protein